jgi:hypothetical protein
VARVGKRDCGPCKTALGRRRPRVLIPFAAYRSSFVVPNTSSIFCISALIWKGF